MVAHIRIHNDTVFLQYIQLYQIVQLVTRPPIENRAEIKILLNIQQTSSSSRGIQHMNIGLNCELDTVQDSVNEAF